MRSERWFVAAALCGLGCGALGPPPEVRGTGEVSDSGASGVDASTGTTEEPPRVVQVSPANNAMGVSADSPLVITFSRPMDTSATKAALGSSQLDFGKVELDWQANDTVLSIKGAALEYASGDLNVAARRYEISVNTSARDAQGRRMAETFRWSFATLRRVTMALKSDITLDGYVRSDGEIDTCREKTLDSAGRSLAACVGFSMAGQAPYAGLLTFGLSPLPANVTRIEKATLSVYQYRTDGKPYMFLGVVNVDHVLYATKQEAYKTGALSKLGLLSNDETTEWKRLETSALTAAIQENFEKRVERKARAQLRLVFTMPDSPLAVAGHVAKFYTSMVEQAAMDPEDPDRNGKYPRLEVIFLAP